jgi:hypothetical protein
MLIISRRQSSETSTRVMEMNTKKVSTDITQAEAGYTKHMEAMHDDAAASASL